MGTGTAPGAEVGGSAGPRPEPPAPRRGAPPDLPPVPAADALRDLGEALAGATTTGEVVAAVLGAGHRVLGSSTCGFSLYDEQARVLRPQEPTGLPAGHFGTARVVPLDDAAPSAAAARERRPVLLRNPAELAAAYDSPLNAAVLEQGERSWAMLPMLAHGRLVGVLRFGFAREGSLGPAATTFARTLAGQCALALERVRSLEAAREAAQAVALSEQRYRTLAAATSLDVFTATPAEGIVTDLPHWRALTGRAGPVEGFGWLADLPAEEAAALRSAWREALGSGTVLRRRFPVRAGAAERTLSMVVVPVRAAPDGSGPVLEWVGAVADVTEEVVATARAVALQRLGERLVTALTEEDVVTAVLRTARDDAGAAGAAVALLGPDGGLDVRVLRGERPQPWSVEPSAGHSALLEHLCRHGGRFLRGPDALRGVPAALRHLVEPGLAAGDRAWALLPLSARSGRLGALVLGFAAEAAGEDPAQRSFLVALARQAATALERAQLLAAERSTTRVLQEALQPGPLPEVPWLAAARRTATSAGMDVGGDWAELIDLGDGRAALVLGDVMGRGAVAATVMGRVRTQVRTLAALDPEPRTVLRRLDRLVDQQPERPGCGDLVTLFYGLLEPGGHLRAASAGHVPPMLLAAGGCRYLDVVPGTPLGVGGDDRADVLAVDLPARAGLVVYSDGLVETRTRPLGEGMAQVLRLVRGMPLAAPEEVCDALLAGMTAGQVVDDDVTVLCVRLRPGSAGRS